MTIVRAGRGEGNRYARGGSKVGTTSYAGTTRRGRTTATPLAWDNSNELDVRPRPSDARRARHALSRRGGSARARRRRRAVARDSCRRAMGVVARPGSAGVRDRAGAEEGCAAHRAARDQAARAAGGSVPISVARAAACPTARCNALAEVPAAGAARRTNACATDDSAGASRRTGSDTARHRTTASRTGHHAARGAGACRPVFVHRREATRPW